MCPTPYQNDLFISYAHIDNQFFSEKTKGWIDMLHERLEIRLAQLLGTPPNIWRDKKLRGSDDFEETLVIELSRSAIFVSVVSPRYVSSSSCRKEVEFIDSEFKRRALADKRCVFKIIKTYVPLNDHPLSLRDLLGYEFYERNEASGRVYEFDAEISGQGEKDKRYWNKFEDLAWDIHELIKFLEKPDPTPAKPSGATIYLAETTSDLTEQRDKVRRELTQNGHIVLPDKALPLEASAFQSTVREYLRSSQLSVHLIGEYYGLIPEKETERSIVRLQEELAVERGDDAHFSRLIWMPPGLEPKDDRQKKFVVDLQTSFSSHNGSELLQVKLEDLKTIIQLKLAPKAKPAVVLPQSNTARIYLICDPTDVESVDPLYNYLLDQGYETTLPLMDGSAAEALEDHKENLLMCDAVLIFQGKASEAWLRMKLRELLKLPGYGRTTPLLDTAVYIGGPASAAKDRFRILERTIKNYGDFDPATLEPFIAAITKAKGGRQ
jgi:hypothetical protein